MPDGDLVLFDPQAHSGSLYVVRLSTVNVNACSDTVLLIIRDPDGRLGFWDKGPKQIEEYFKVHKCNAICRQLSLDREPKMVNGKKMDMRMSISTILQ